MKLNLQQEIAMLTERSAQQKHQVCVVHLVMYIMVFSVFVD